MFTDIFINTSAVRKQIATVNDLIGDVEQRTARWDTVKQKMDPEDMALLREAHSNRPLEHLLAMVSETCPLPMWIKDHNGRMIWVNKQYEKQFGEYIGQFDEEHWDQSTAVGFDENDAWVRENMAPMNCVERFVNPKTGDKELIHVVKWPVLVGNEVRVCVAGTGMGRYKE